MAAKTKLIFLLLVFISCNKYDLNECNDPRVVYMELPDRSLLSKLENGEQIVFINDLGFYQSLSFIGIYGDKIQYKEYDKNSNYLYSERCVVYKIPNIIGAFIASLYPMALSVYTYTDPVTQKFELKLTDRYYVGSSLHDETNTMSLINNDSFKYSNAVYSPDKSQSKDYYANFYPVYTNKLNATFTNVYKLFFYEAEAEGRESVREVLFSKEYGIVEYSTKSQRWYRVN